MRLWTLHPAYLDAKGLTALWREALLARAVLENRTRGYRRHPQLERFRAASKPLAAIGAYLAAILAEARRRGFRFDCRKCPRDANAPLLLATRGQLEWERSHLAWKLWNRDRAAWRRLSVCRQIRPHPLFRIVPGPVASWERGNHAGVGDKRRRHNTARRAILGE